MENVQPAGDGPPLPAVVYAAKSTEDVRGSIPTQIADCREQITREGGRVVVGEEQDEGISGYRSSRGPGLERAKLRACEAARGHGAAELWVQHSDRIARGDGRTADHLAEVFFAMRKAGVRLRSVQDDANLEDVIRVALIGERNNEDSKRKGAAVAAGLRRAAERGDWTGGPAPDGYRVIRSVDERGRVTRSLEFDPDRVEVFRLIWESAVAGWSAESIVLELDRRGVKTNPQQAGAKPKPFDSNRIRQTLNRPVYAGLSVSRKEIVGPGNWPAYVSPEDFHRARAERERRASRQPGRPRREVQDYLLSGLARCGECGGPIVGVTGRGSKNQRRDGTWPRRYVCEAHGRNYPPTHSAWCPAPPIDADVVDRAFASHMDSFLGDVAGWRDRLTASRTAERERLASEVSRATSELEESDRIAAKLGARIERAIAEDDDEKAEALSDLLVARRRDRALVERRLQAASDAHVQVGEPVDLDPLLDFYFALQDELGGRVCDGDTVKRLNQTLRDYFGAVVLTAEADGVRVAPHLAEVVAARLAAEIDGLRSIVADGSERLRPPLRVRLDSPDDEDDGGLRRDDDGWPLPKGPPPPGAILPPLEHEMTPGQAAEVLERFAGKNPPTGW